MLPNAALKAVRSATSASPRSWVTGWLCPTSVDAPRCQSRSAASNLSAMLPPLPRPAARLLVDVRFSPAQAPPARAHPALGVGGVPLVVPELPGPGPGVAGGRGGVGEVV